MADTKYGNLLTTLKFMEGRGGANARELVFVGGDRLAGFDLNFIIGVYDQVGDWAPGMGAHVHPFDELLLFFGYDDEDMNILGSDMSLALGKEQEVHRFSVPTVAVAPQNLPHCPLITEKAHRDFGHFHLALSAKYSGEGVPQEGTTDGTKYAHLVNKMTARKGPGGADAKQVIAVSGDELEGLNINFRMGLYNQPGEWYPGEGARVHPYDECLVFFGHKTEDLSYLGAEITIEIGQEHEKHTFDVPTVVALPKGTPHYPITCNRVERPYGVMKVGLGARYQSSQAD
ncbi:MAG: hypothetical protein JXA51_00965 [Dehalococcoidales bacterium]|nr:hypothetical protein [Dehalococcoidales bacterium]